MEADWLAAQLEAGRSIESIARELGKPASTVAYWVNEHGLTSQYSRTTRAWREPADRRRPLPLQAVSNRRGERPATARQAHPRTRGRWRMPALRLLAVRAEVEAGIATIGASSDSL
jgi:transposase-like protein